MVDSYCCQVRLALKFCLAMHCLKRRVILGLLQLEWEKMALCKITKRKSLCGRFLLSWCENPFYSYFTEVEYCAQGTPKRGDRETLYFLYQEPLKHKVSLALT